MTTIETSGPEGNLDTYPPRVIVLDGGAQYVDMIVKASERHGFPTDIRPIDTPIEEYPDTTEAVIVSGGPKSVHQDSAPLPDDRLYEQDDLATLSICYGVQSLAVLSGGVVSTREYRSDGIRQTNVVTEHPLFTGIRKETTALFTHGDFIDELPETLEVIGSHEVDGELVISAVSKGRHVGVQFHPEMFEDTPQGYEMISNFFRFIAEIEPDETYLETMMSRQIADKQEHIKERVGDKDVIAFVSGGVDSAVAVKLAQDVVDPEKLHMFFIDNGYMRDEDEEVIETLAEAGLSVTKIDAQEYFEQATTVMPETNETVGPLIDVVNPEHKREIIGDAFVDIMFQIIEEQGFDKENVVLLQGTNAADRIESGHSKGDGDTATIKKHHNQVARVRALNPIEPLDDLFKDEIRALAVALGLPEEIAYRQPFPGPGTAIRILGLSEDGYDEQPAEHEAAITSAIDTINTDYDLALQAKLLPVRSVGVGGDARSHIKAIALEGDIESSQLSEISTRLTNENRETTNRVVHKLGGDSIDSITPIETKPDVAMRKTLRSADKIVFEAMREMELLRSIEQFPVILLPMGTDGQRSIVLRPITTRTHMTVQAMLPGEGEKQIPQAFFDKVTNRILEEVDGISHVFLDATNKPPGTTEWE